jgi:hypothetical protein
MEPELVIPPGKKTGCLIRKYKPGEAFPLFSERIDVIDPDNWDNYVSSVNLRPYVKHIYDQDAVGSCATESASQAVKIVRAFQNLPYVELNPLSVYAFTSGGRDNGSNIDENLRRVKEVGILPMDLWPRSKGWKIKPPKDLLDAEACKYRVDEVYDISTMAEFGTALLKWMPVVFGWSGHSCVATGLKRTSGGVWVFEYANSWDDDWGDEGFGELRLSSVNFGYGAWAVRTVVSG